VLGCEDARGARVTPDDRSARGSAPRLLPHAVSLLRPLLGVLLLSRVSAEGAQTVVLPIVLLACASDWADGELARRAGATSRTGRLVDNLCDFAFLSCLFAFFALGDVWSPPVWGRLVRNWADANWLPLYALLASFGVYFARLCLDFVAGRDPVRSPRGHLAGVSNYLLAVLGAVEMLPGVGLGPWVLEPAMVTVALLNILAVPENVLLVVRGQIPPGSPRA
jgi:phosphatidylglycerophosphate synthase